MQMSTFRTNTSERWFEPIDLTTTAAQSRKLRHNPAFRPTSEQSSDDQRQISAQYCNIWRADLRAVIYIHPVTPSAFVSVALYGRETSLGILKELTPSIQTNNPIPLLQIQATRRTH